MTRIRHLLPAPGWGDTRNQGQQRLVSPWAGLPQRECWHQLLAGSGNVWSELGLRHYPAVWPQACTLTSLGQLHHLQTEDNHSPAVLGLCGYA